jgi:hypothetical protein
MTLLEQLDRQRRENEAKLKEAEAQAAAARAAQKQLEADRDKLLEATAIAAGYGYGWAPVPAAKNIVIAPITKPEPPEALKLPPPEEPVKPQGSQPGRSVPHAPPSQVLDFPFPNQVGALVRILLGCDYVEPFDPLHQKYKMAAPLTVLHVQLAEGIVGPSFVCVAYLVKAVRLPYQWVVAMLTALSRVPVSIRLIEPYGDHRWRFTDLGERLFGRDEFGPIEEMAALYETFFEPFSIGKVRKSRAVYIGERIKINERAVLEAHRKLGLMVALKRVPVTADAALADLDAKETKPGQSVA